MTTDEIIAEVIAMQMKKMKLPRDNQDLPKAEQQQEYKAQQLTFHTACEEFCDRIRATQGPTAFDALFWLANLYGGGEYAIPDFASHILFYLKPPCPLSCVEAVRAVALSQWNVSVEEVPWYLASQFGPETVYEAVAAVEKEAFIVEIERQRKLWFHEMERRHGGERIYMIKGLPQFPGGAAPVLLNTIRYWLGFYVEDRDNKVSEWSPPWQWH